MTTTPATSPILMVDDSDDDLLLARLCHRGANLESPFVTLKSGKALLDYLDKVQRDEEPMPSVVLLDINMPGLSGFDTLERIRAIPTFAKIPVIMMLTHSDRPEDATKAKELGANGFYTKPYDVNEYQQFFTDLSRSA